MIIKGLRIVVALLHGPSHRFLCNTLLNKNSEISKFGTETYQAVRQLDLLTLQVGFIETDRVALRLTHS